jgi:hypothetical protein
MKNTIRVRKNNASKQTALQVQTPSVDTLQRCADSLSMAVTAVKKVNLLISNYPLLKHVPPGDRESLNDLFTVEYVVMNNLEMEMTKLLKAAYPNKI